MEAVLAAGHIPAAMEQFSPGDETAWEKIRTFIDASDAFILILGGRYGSIEPVSGKSYVQLEYEYARDQRKPFFAVVVDEAHHEERVKELGLEAVDERRHRREYDDFRRMVEQRLCGYWTDVKDIKLAVALKLPEWSMNPQLVGWVRGDEILTPQVTSELARLSQENNELRSRLKSLADTYDGMSFEQLVKALREAQFETPPDNNSWQAVLEFCEQKHVTETVTEAIERKPRNAGELFDDTHEAFSGAGIRLPIGNLVPTYRLEEILRSLFSHGLIASERVEPRVSGRTSYSMGQGMQNEETVHYEGGSITYKLTDAGRRFRNRMLTAGDREARRRLLWSGESGEDRESAASA
jgi:hypothetical protein